jgi:nucleotide-binding universal stress UspA family protein
MYSNVLLPTDGSDRAERAVDAGIEQAARFDASVHALSVIDSRFRPMEYDPVVERAEQEAETALEAVASRCAAAGVPVERHLRRGVPHEEILEAIDAYSVDLVVMGTHGRTGLDRIANLGSVTERVVRAAPVSVLTVPIGRSDDAAP